MALKWFKNEQNGRYIAINPEHVISVEELRVENNGQKVSEINVAVNAKYKVFGTIDDVVSKLNEKD
jgi:hypothetical protein